MMTADSDGSSLGIQILIIVLLTAINAFFAAAEIAFVSINQGKMSQKASEGDKKAQRVMRLLENSDAGKDPKTPIKTSCVESLVQKDSHVAYHNHIDEITPTGVVLTVAPYAMMLAVAGSMGFMFFNRKKEEE